MSTMTDTTSAMPSALNSTVQPYPAGTLWRFRPRIVGAEEFTCELAYVWEVDFSSMSNDYAPEDISARDLYLEWVRRYGTPSLGGVR
jgi:hypothetical protein